MATTPKSWYGGDVSVQAIEGPSKEKPHQGIRSAAASPGQEPVTFNATVKEEEAREALRSGGVNETAQQQQASNDKNTQPLTHTADDASGGRQGAVNDTQPGPPPNAPTAPRSFGWGVAGRGGISPNAPRGPRSFFVGTIRGGDGPAAQVGGNGVPPNAPTGPRAMMYRSNANPYPVVKRDMRR